MMRPRQLRFAALLIVLTGVCVVMFTVTTQNASRKPTARASIPSRIVSLAPSNTEILFALGLESRVVGVTDYCDYPPAAKKKSKVGDMNTNLEKVIALKPDLVLAHGKLNDNLIKRLRSLHIKVMAPDPKTFAQTYADIKSVGQVTGRSAEAGVITRKMAGVVSNVKSKTTHTKSKKVLVIIQPNPLWAAGPNTFVDEMLKYSHATNVAHDARSGFNQFSTEVAVSRNPDVIIVSRKEERDFIVQSAMWKQTNAVKHKAVFVVDGDLTLRPGPRLTEGLLQVARAIHPEAFK